MDLVRAIERYCAEPCCWSVGDDLSSLEWAEGNPLPKPTPEDLEAAWAECQLDRLRQYAAGKRRSLVQGAAAINVGSRSIPTWVDPESRGAATGLVVALGLVPSLTAPWKGSDRQFYELASDEIPAFALGMQQFVQSAFGVEGAVLTAIDAGTITTVEQIDAAPWPQALT